MNITILTVKENQYNYYVIYAYNYFRLIKRSLEIY